MQSRGKLMPFAGLRGMANALSRTTNGILARTGQVCVAASRLYVHKSISEKFISQYVERMKAASTGIGDPQDPDTKYGPLADSLAFEKVRAMIARAREEAELVVGGNQIGTEGSFIEPTVFVNPKPDAEIYKSEVFGPVAVIKTFDTEAEVIQAANDTEYGLMAGVFTRDITRALRVSARIDSGVVGVNCVSMVRCWFLCRFLRVVLYKANSGVIDECPSSLWREEGVWNWTRVWGIREF